MEGLTLEERIAELEAENAALQEQVTVLVATSSCTTLG
jgi:uncharacterized coiled-coil protein SlyX